MANRSGQFEARLSLVKVTESASLFFSGMAGSLLPVATAHGEGRAQFHGQLLPQIQIALQYVNTAGNALQCNIHKTRTVLPPVLPVCAIPMAG